VSRTKVKRWAPPLPQALRLALRPAVAFTLFTLFGFVAFTLAIVVYENSPGDLLEILLAVAAGMIGLVLGQLGAVLRLRVLPIVLLGGISMAAGIYLVEAASVPIPRQIVPAIAFFCMALPCGLLSMQHRYELLASFWPAVGWIGGVFIILNHEGRVTQWEQDKTSAWLPVPLLFLAGFLVFWLFYLASKQAMRVELWQALSGAAARRVVKKATVTAVPRKNVGAILVVALALFAMTAILAPYLWRTGKGDRPTEQKIEQQQEKPKPRPQMNGDEIVAMMKKLAQAAKDTALHLWPLLFLLLLYRPAKRALLQSHLLTPVFPTPPTERIENLWEYVRIAAEDAKVVPHPSDSVEQLMARIQKSEIYARTRYGFTVGPGDPLAMRPAAIEAARELRVRLGTWDKIKAWWRPLS